MYARLAGRLLPLPQVCTHPKFGGITLSGLFRRAVQLWGNACPRKVHGYSLNPIHLHKFVMHLVCPNVVMLYRKM